LSHDCILSEDTFQALNRPIAAGRQRASGLRFAERLPRRRFAPASRRLVGLRSGVDLPGRHHLPTAPATPAWFNSAHAQQLPLSVTDSGFRVALFFTRTYNRLLRPGLAAALPALRAISTPLKRARTEPLNVITQDDTRAIVETSGQKIDFIDFPGVRGEWTGIYFSNTSSVALDDERPLAVFRDYRLIPINAGARLLFVQPVSAHKVDLRLGKGLSFSENIDNFVQAVRVHFRFGRPSSQQHALAQPPALYVPERILDFSKAARQNGISARVGRAVSRGGAGSKRMRELFFSSCESGRKRT
jgi:hypothetical protein